MARIHTAEHPGRPHFRLTDYPLDSSRELSSGILKPVIEDRMTPEERFERIERNLAAAAEVIHANAESLIETRHALAGLARSHELQQNSMASLIESHELQQSSMASLIESQMVLSQRVAEYVADSKERMKQLEASLDALIRIITAEHSNGKGKLG
jgi:septal ring factor EnvC (AmiA/AmiB activator)